MYEVGTMFEGEKVSSGNAWNETVFESKSFDEAYNYCKNDRSNSRLWLYDTTSNSDSRFFLNGEEYEEEEE